MMQTKGWMMMRVLCNRFHGEAAGALLSKYMPQSMANEVLGQTITSTDLSAALMFPEDLLKRIHYSWLQPLFQKIPEILHSYVLSALPESHFSGLSRLLNKEIKPFPMVPQVRTFFINMLCKHLEVPLLLPTTFLPPSKISMLVNYTKQQLMELIDFLGLHDLAEEMRFILDKNQLKILFGLLSIKKQNYLKRCMANKERFPTQRLNLEQWKGTRQQLEVLLHKRGLERLAKALAGQHPDLLWYVVHILDTGRGTMLNKAIPQNEEPGMTAYMVQQLVQLTHFLKEGVEVE